MDDQSGFERGKRKQLSVQIFTFLRLCATLNKILHLDPEDLSCLVLFNLRKALFKQINKWRTLSLHFLKKTCEV